MSNIAQDETFLRKLRHGRISSVFRPGDQWYGARIYFEHQLPLVIVATPGDNISRESLKNQMELMFKSQIMHGNRYRSNSTGVDVHEVSRDTSVFPIHEYEVLVVSPREVTLRI